MGSPLQGARRVTSIYITASFKVGIGGLVELDTQSHLFACAEDYLPACLPAFQHDCLPFSMTACLLSSMLPCLFACRSVGLQCTCLPTWLPTFNPIWLPACLSRSQCGYNKFGWVWRFMFLSCLSCLKPHQYVPYCVCCSSALSLSYLFGRTG